MVTADALLFEFMLNALRLRQSIPLTLLRERTGLPLLMVEAPIQRACEQGLLQQENEQLQTTPLGQRFTNDLVALFLS